MGRVRFAGLYPRKDDFMAAFSLHRWLKSRRIVKTVDYGPRWRSHYVLLQLQHRQRSLTAELAISDR